MDRIDFLKGATLITGFGLINYILQSCVNDHGIQPSNVPVSQPDILPNTTITNNTISGTTTTTSPPITVTSSPINNPNIPNNPILSLDLNASSYSKLKSAGGYIISKNIIVAYTGSSYAAVSSICTHQGCSVNYNSSAFFCPCHNAKFDINGKVVYGPPPTPLRKYTTTLIGNILYIS